MRERHLIGACVVRQLQVTRYRSNRVEQFQFFAGSCQENRTLSTITRSLPS